MDREEIEIALPYLEEMKEYYTEGEGYERHPLPEYYAIEAAIRGLDELSHLKDAKEKTKEQKSEVCLDAEDYDYFKRVLETYSKFSDRMEACEVWAGLDRPWIALGDVCGNIKGLLYEFSKEDIKAGEVTSSLKCYSNSRLRLEADRLCCEMDVNYSDLAKQVMDVENMGRKDKYIVVAALEHDYIKALQDGVKVLSDIYEARTGKNLLEDYLHEVDEEKTWVNIPNELRLKDEFDGKDEPDDR